MFKGKYIFMVGKTFGMTNIRNYDENYFVFFNLIFTNIFRIESIIESKKLLIYNSIVEWKVELWST